MFKNAISVGASALAGMILAFAMVATAAAWHPEGQIKKYVQNVTSDSPLADAETADQAVEAKSGETLKYVIEIKNAGKADSRGWNDMHFVVLRDTLPEGVELVSDPAKREIVENIGVIKAGQKVTKEYEVRVTSDEDDAVVTNTACFTGDSEVRDNKQSGCDDAVVKLTVPEPEPEPEPEEEPEEEPEVLSESKGGGKPTVLPETGAGSIVVAFTGVSGLGYAFHSFVNRKRQ